jgi:hypothetical protein
MVPAQSMNDVCHPITMVATVQYFQAIVHDLDGLPIHNFHAAGVWDFSYAFRIAATYRHGSAA